MFRCFGAMGFPEGSRILILIAMSGLWQVYLVECSSQVFMLGFPENRLPGNSNLLITVTNTCERRISVSIRSYVSSNLITFLLQPAASNTTAVPGELMVKGTVKSKQGVKVTTTGKAKVYIEVDQTSAKEGTLVIPLRFLGNRYYVVTGVSTEGATQSEILLVGVTNLTDVVVTIYTTTIAVYNGDMYFSGEVIHVQLDEFDTVQIQSDSGDLTGTHIESSLPISVFSGNQAVSINTNVGYLLEQMPAIRYLQTEFVIVPPKGFGYKCKIVAAYSWTYVRYQCSLAVWHDVLLISSGADVTLHLGGAFCTVTATKPILLTLIIQALTLNPAMVVIQPIREFHINVTFYVPESLEYAQVIVLTYTNDIYDMTLDNESLTNVMTPSFEPLYVSVAEDIKSGTHFIKTSGPFLRISGYIFGWVGGKTSALPLVFLQNRSCDVNTITTTTTFVDGVFDNPTTTVPNNVALDTTIASDIYVRDVIITGTPEPTTNTAISSFDGTPEPTTNTAIPFDGTPEPTTNTAISSFDGTPEPTTNTAIPFDGTPEPTTNTAISSFDGTPEPTTNKAIPFDGTPEPTTNTAISSFDGTPEPTTNTAIPFDGTPEPTTNTAISSFDGTPEPTTNTAIPFDGTPEPTTNTAIPFDGTLELTTATTAVALVSSDPISETTSVTVLETSELTTETTAPNLEGSTGTEFETIGITVGTTETTAINVDTTTVAVVDGTLFAISSDSTTGPTLVPKDGATTSPEAAVTTITRSLSPAPTRSSIRPVICGTFPWTNMTCFKYCANRTKEMNVRIVDMHANLIDRKSTSRYLRSLTSALDDRTSAQTIGYSGVIVLVSVFLFVIILDVKAGGKSKKRSLRNPV